MLLQFTVENFKSFRDKQEFSLVASRERQHGQSLRRPFSYLPRILPIAAIYGANASGKSNLFHALGIFKNFIVRGIDPDGFIFIKTFLLDTDYYNAPTTFSIMIEINKTIYEYTISSTPNYIEHEKLSTLNSVGEKIIFERNKQDIKLLDLPKGTDREHLKFLSQSTRKNQAFLTTCHQFNAKGMTDVIVWLNHNLVLIAPHTIDTSVADYADGSHIFSAQFNNILSGLDTHISRLSLQDLPPEQTGIPVEFINHVTEHLKEGKSHVVTNNINGQRFTISREEGKVIAKKIVATHPVLQGGEVDFELMEESDGTRRMIDLLPSLLSLSEPNSERVLIIDELDRSLHPNLTKHLIKLYLKSCTEESRSQLIFSTHDAMLFTQELFRRDELWLVEKDANGASHIFSLAEFKNKRYDEVIRKGYLAGRMGGIPNLF